VHLRAEKEILIYLLRRLLSTVVQLRRTMFLHHSYTMLPMYSLQ